MPDNEKGPAGDDRQGLMLYRRNLSILPLERPKCSVRQLATVYREAIASDDIRVVRTVLELLWRHVREMETA
jgi:hypothetical protein